MTSVAGQLLCEPYPPAACQLRERVRGDIAWKATFASWYIGNAPNFWNRSTLAHLFSSSFFFFFFLVSFFLFFFRSFFFFSSNCSWLTR